MTPADDRTIRVRITGSPSVATIAEASAAIVALVGPAVITARCACDFCDAISEPVDTSDPDAAEVALREAGWSRDPITRTDLCPACAA
ncbi:MAG: hypothetical protein ACOH10_12615 [Rhodoglobus sp.]